MTDAVRVHTSTRIATDPPPASFEWKADAADGDRHAFPQRNGFPPPAICGARWTVRFAYAGATWCEGCVSELRAQLLAAAVALAPVEAEDLAAGDDPNDCPICSGMCADGHPALAEDQAGDHFAGMPG